MNTRDAERLFSKMNAVINEEHEKAMIKRAIEAIKRCVANHDMQTVLVLVELCKYIAGDDFQVWIETESEGTKDVN